MLRIAHRGASGYMPENTISAIKKALELNCDIIEVDARTAKSGEVVVFHDSHIDRLTKSQGKVSSLNLADLKSLVLPKNERIPTLEEALLFIGRKSRVNIDLKERRAIEPTVRLIEKFVQKHNWEYSDFCLSAFWLFFLKRAQQLNPKIPLAPNITFFPRIFLTQTHKYKMTTIKFSKRAIRKHQIQTAHERGQKVWVWTVDNPKDIEKYKEWGVDGIVSNFPDRI